jgi:folate-binding protein YgfZ
MTITVARTRRDVVSVTGPDAAAYLQGQLSQDVAGLAVGDAAPTFVLAPQGKVDGWGRVHRQAADAFAIDVDAGAGASWEARLRRFLLRTDAQIEVAADVPALEVRGAVPDGALPPLSPAELGGDLIGWSGEDLPDAVAADGVEVDAAAADAARIRAGVPRWGAEIDEDTIPATLGQWLIDASVSFTKGCYTGQELVARIDSRGGNVPRVLVGVLVDGAVPAVGDPVLVGDQEIGSVTSAAPDPETGGSSGVGLTFAPRSVAVGAEGTAATVGGRAARLVPVPITPGG